MTAVATFTPKLTVTEALAEIKTLTKRIEKRRENVMPYLFRQKMITDPLENDVQGGSAEFVRRERQGAADLEARLIALRTAIQGLNLRELISIDGESKSVAAWLTWRKEVLPGQRTFLQNLRTRIEQVRKEAGQKQVGIVNVDTSQQAKYNDVIVNMNEADLAKEIEHIELVVGTLDGQLSLKNATTTITV